MRPTLVALIIRSLWQADLLLLGTSQQSGISHQASDIPPSAPHATAVVPSYTNSTTSKPHTGPCTGCVIQAYNPKTTSYDAKDVYNPWTSLVVTETILLQYVTYLYNGTIDTVVTESTTVNQTKTVVYGTSDATITHSTPTFIVTPTPGVYVTLDAGPTYVIYDDLSGGLDAKVEKPYSSLGQTLQSCVAYPTKLENWQPTATEDWHYFIETYTASLPAAATNLPVSLPAKLIKYLKQDPDIGEQFSGSDIATCTQRVTGKPNVLPSETVIISEVFSTETGTRSKPVGTFLPNIPATTTPSTNLPPAEITGAPSVTTGTFLSTTFASTSTHITRQGCLRCENTQPAAKPTPTPSDDGKASAKIQDDPTPGPSDKPKPENPIPQTTPGPKITIGSEVFPINPVRPTQNTDKPDGQNQIPTVVVIGYDTFTPGQTKTINGVPVVVPTDGGGSRVVVAGNTVAFNPTALPVGPPVLTVGNNPVTANPQGEFVVGTATLKPGGPQVVADGRTLSLGPNGEVAVVNGVTQTLAYAPAPIATPAITVGGEVITATVLSGTPVYVFAPGQTLTPGGALTVSGTTYALPASADGNVVVINGVTSTLASSPAITAAPAIVVAGKTYAATVVDGTTEYVIGTAMTLKPGQAVTVSGTTYSLDTKGTALVVNGQTSTISRVPASNSASTTRSSVRSPSSASSSSSTSTRGAGDLIASGIGQTSKGGGVSGYGVGGVDRWIEGLMMGVAGWVMVLL